MFYTVHSLYYLQQNEKIIVLKKKYMQDPSGGAQDWTSRAQSEPKQTFNNTTGTNQIINVRHVIESTLINVILIFSLSISSNISHLLQNSLIIRYHYV